VKLTVAAQREKEGVGKSGGRLEGKGGRGWFREGVEPVGKRVRVIRGFSLFIGRSSV
jgi:hypothetical protein